MKKKQVSGNKIRFGIRFKLLLLSLLILSIPYIGYQYLRELDRHLRENLESSLTDAARAIAGPLHENYLLFPYVSSNPEHTLFIHQLDIPIQVDGYADDWENYTDWMEEYKPEVQSDGKNRTSFKAILGQKDQTVYIFIHVQDKKVIYHQPADERNLNSDYVEMVVSDDYQVQQRYYFSPSAPGRFSPFQIQLVSGEWEDYEYIRYSTNITADWQQTPDGYNLEISIPVNMLNQRLGLIVGNVDDLSKNISIPTTGTAGKSTASYPGRLLRPSGKLTRLITRLDDTPGRRIWVLDANGQVLASVGNLRDDLQNHPMNIFYKLLLPSVSSNFVDEFAGVSRIQGAEVQAALMGKTSSRWRSSPDQKAVIVSAATPVWVSDTVRGVVMVEETTNNIQLLQRDALVSLMNKIMVVFLVVTLLLIIFATRLSIRLRKLSEQASAAIDEHGRVVGNVSISKATDEIGEMSRSYANMLQRLREYNNYLESLASKLSHELRTPMAVVQTSLDNLEAEIQQQDSIYLQRARSGMQRLHQLVTRLSEAARLEQALQTAEKQSIDITQLLKQAVAGYRQIYSEHEINLTVPDKAIYILISPDLFLQMLDKIVSNAVDFSAQSKPIEITVSRNGEKITMEIINYGSSLPDTMEGQLFNSMISVRNENKKESAHLGLGLFIARMVAEFHQARLGAENLPDNSGVKFVLQMKCIPG